jgi:hypothetical protein
MCYMHYDAPTHCSIAVRDVLNNTYHDRWIGRGGPTAWPPHSRDSNPLYLNRGDTKRALCIQLLLTKQRHLSITLWMSVGPSATTAASLDGCGSP